MKKILFAAAIAASFSSQAVNVNPDGSGQVLLYPFYTVKNNFDTYIHITNTTNETKAVKVRFSEGKNTWEVLDFNLYLSPYDVWTGVLVSTSAGGVKLKTTDTSCTVPKIPTAGVDFRNVLYTSSDINGNGEPETDKSMSRLQEGHLEVIEMGVVLDTADNKFATAIEHVNGVPADCKSINDAWAGGAWSADRNTAMSAPTGGLSGLAKLIDVQSGYMTTYDATAIDSFWDLTGVGRSAHNRPGTSFPDLNGRVEQGNSLLNLGKKESNVFANGQLVTSTWDETVDALSAVLMSSKIGNDYSVSASVNATSDWVVSFPTKHFYVNGQESRNGLGPNRAPFTSSFEADNDDGACEAISLAYYDREEREAVGSSSGVDFSPSQSQAGPSLCWETSRITFNNSPFFGQSNTVSNITIPYQEGWASVTFNGVMKSKEGHRYNGLPVVGFSTVSAKNGTLSGGRTLANYAGSFSHKRERKVN